MDLDFIIGATIVILGAWGLAAFVLTLAKMEKKRRKWTPTIRRLS